MVVTRSAQWSRVGDGPPGSWVPCSRLAPSEGSVDSLFATGDLLLNLEALTRGRDHGGTRHRTEEIRNSASSNSRTYQYGTRRTPAPGPRRRRPLRRPRRPRPAGCPRGRTAPHPRRLHERMGRGRWNPVPALHQRSATPRRCAPDLRFHAGRGCPGPVLQHRVAARARPRDIVSRGLARSSSTAGRRRCHAHSMPSSRSALSGRVSCCIVTVHRAGG